MAILIFVILIVAVAVIFSYQNSAVVTLSFASWKFTASLAIIVFLAVLTGMVIMALLWVGTSFRKRVKKRSGPQEVAAAVPKDRLPANETPKGP